jgi:hypothetical protein
VVRNKGAVHQPSEQADMADMADRAVAAERHRQGAGKMDDDARSTLLAFL